MKKALMGLALLGASVPAFANAEVFGVELGKGFQGIYLKTEVMKDDGVRVFWIEPPEGKHLWDSFRVSVNTNGLICGLSLTYEAENRLSKDVLALDDEVVGYLREQLGVGLPSRLAHNVLLVEWDSEDAMLGSTIPDDINYAELIVMPMPMGEGRYRNLSVEGHVDCLS